MIIQRKNIDKTAFCRRALSNEFIVNGWSESFGSSAGTIATMRSIDWHQKKNDEI